MQMSNSNTIHSISQTTIATPNTLAPGRHRHVNNTNHSSTNAVWEPNYYRMTPHYAMAACIESVMSAGGRARTHTHTYLTEGRAEERPSPTWLTENGLTGHAHPTHAFTHHWRIP